MKAPTARKYLILIFLTIFVLGIAYIFVLGPLQIPLIDFLVKAAIALLSIGFIVIKNRFYCCPKCGQHLAMGNIVSFQKKCPYCKKPLE